eukprot:319720-Alexandrium_andersonii.AAC.1
MARRASAMSNASPCSASAHHTASKYRRSWPQILTVRMSSTGGVVARGHPALDKLRDPLALGGRGTRRRAEKRTCTRTVTRHSPAPSCDPKHPDL